MNIQSNPFPEQQVLERFPAKSNLVRIEKTRQIKNLEPRYDSIGTEKAVVERRGFTTADILWAIGVWSVILTLSPVVMFYVLMVN